MVPDWLASFVIRPHKALYLWCSVYGMDFRGIAFQFPYVKVPRPSLWSTHSLSKWAPESLSWKQNGRSAKLTIYLQLAPGLRMCGTIPLILHTPSGRVRRHGLDVRLSIPSAHLYFACDGETDQQTETSLSKRDNDCCRH